MAKPKKSAETVVESVEFVETVEAVEVAEKQEKVSKRDLALARKAYEEEKAAEERKEKMEYLKKYASANANSSNPEIMKVLVEEEFGQFLIMKNPSESKGAVHELAINGQVFLFPKGKRFYAPLSIIDMLNEFYEIEESSGSEFRIDRNEDTVRALSR